MTVHLAAEGLVTASSWPVVAFRRVAEPITSRNLDGCAQMLSLASSGLVSSREGEGRQIASDDTIRRGWRVSPGNLVVNPMWLIGGGIGVSDVTGAVSPDYRVYRFASTIHPRFMHHLLRTSAYRDQYRLYTRADTTFDRRVGKDEFHEMPVVVPPLDEQRRIADFLDTQVALLDRAIELRHEQCALLGEHRRTVVADAYGAGDDLLGIVIGSHASKHRWPSRKLSTALRTTVAGGTPATDNVSYWSEDDAGLPWVSIGDLVEGGITWRTAKSLTIDGAAAVRLRPSLAGTVLFAMYASVGKTSILGCPAAWNQAILGLIPSPELLDRYLLHWLELVRPVLPAIARSATQDNLNAEQVRAIRLPLPNLAQQRRVVDLIGVEDEGSNRLTSLYEAQIVLLSERKQALITAAVTGQFDVSAARSVA